MAHYIKKSVVVEAITFAEFIEHGKNNTENMVNGMPWSFEYNGHPVTHENDKCYLIPTLEGVHNFTPDDMLITGIQGEIYPCKIDIFNDSYASNSSLSFGQAIELLKRGKKLARKGWNGSNMFVVYQKGYPDGIPCNKQTAEAWGLNEGDLFKVRPYLQLRTSQGDHAMWSPSTSDALAEDWEVVG
jgi:hypothetical protein